MTWDTSIDNECTSTEFISLYTGSVNKTHSTDSMVDASLAIYSTRSSKGLFSVRSTGRTEACGYDVFSTDHPKIFIYEMNQRKPVFKNTAAVAKDLDI